jgi:hypothetical protein
MLRPGCRPPSRFDIGGRLLENVQATMMEDCKELLQGKTVSLALAGWSNVHNEPVVCVSVTTSDGDTYLTDTVGTSGHGHTAEYLTDVASKAIPSCILQFNCHVGSFITDNVANVAKMRR